MVTAAAKVYRSKSFQILTAISLLVIVVWIARFQHSSEFGLYEDDWTIIPKAIDMSLKELTDFVSDYVTHFRGQGRPLHHSFIYLLSNLGWNLDGLQGIYYVGFVIVSFNAILFYLLLRRIHSHQLAIVGALAFALYSADTTQAFLTHSLGLQTALTLFLLASHSYASRKYSLSYIIILMSLLTYETPYLVFIAAPLLCHPWDKGMPKVMARHVGILALLFTGVYLIRAAVGDLHTASLGVDAQLSTSIRHMFQGPLWSLGSYVYGPIQTFRSLDFGIAAVMGLCFPVLLLILFRWAIDRSDSEADVLAARQSQLYKDTVGNTRNKILARMSQEKVMAPLKLAVIGAVMLVLAYPITFTTEPYMIFGRVTRNHFAGVVGNSLLIAAVWMVIVETLRSEWLRFASSVVLALSFATLVGFGQIIQRDYALGWTYQREFWGELLEIIPDAGGGTSIIVDSSGMKESIHIGANVWNMPRVLERIIEFPEHWNTPPSVYKMYGGWLDYLQESNGTFVLDHPVALTPRDHVREVSSVDMILIITDGGGVARQNSPIVIDGEEYPLSTPSDPILPTLNKKTFYNILIPSTDP